MEERNFRSHYYDKVGFRGVEEKKSLEILLKEKPVDRAKLKQFALRFPVPAIHRNFFWQLILGILPDYLDDPLQRFVQIQRYQQYQDLYNCLKLFQISNIYASKPYYHLIMKNLESGTLRIDIYSQLDNQESQEFIKINEAISQVFDCDSEVYWVSKKVFELAKFYSGHLPSLVIYTHKLISREDEQLYEYLKSQNMLNSLHLEGWYGIFFAGILPTMSILRIWDKILGGSNMIMVYVVIALLTRCRTQIFKLNTGHKMEDYIKNLNESTVDQIINDAIDTWLQHGSPLTPGSSSDYLKEKEHGKLTACNSSSSSGSKHVQSSDTETESDLSELSDSDSSEDSGVDSRENREPVPSI